MDTVITVLIVTSIIQTILSLNWALIMFYLDQLIVCFF